MIIPRNRSEFKRVQIINFEAGAKFTDLTFIQTAINPSYANVKVIT